MVDTTTGYKIIFCIPSFPSDVRLLDLCNGPNISRSWILLTLPGKNVGNDTCIFLGNSLNFRFLICRSKIFWHHLIPKSLNCFELLYSIFFSYFAIEDWTSSFFSSNSLFCLATLSFSRLPISRTTLQILSSWSWMAFNTLSNYLLLFSTP